MVVLHVLGWRFLMGEEPLYILPVFVDPPTRSHACVDVLLAGVAQIQGHAQPLGRARRRSVSIVSSKPYTSVRRSLAACSDFSRSDFKILPLGPLVFDFAPNAQHRQTLRPSVDGIRSEALRTFGLQ